MSQQTLSERERLAALAAFLPEFESPQFECGGWSSAESGEPGVVVMPSFNYSIAFQRFVEALYAAGWIIPNADWPSWAATEEASRFRDDPAAIAGASAAQLAWLLTCIVRGDRFSEGSLAACVKSGLIAIILRRARDLASQ